MSEKNPSPTRETILNAPEGLPPRDEAIARIQREISSLEREVDATEQVKTPIGFRASAEELIHARAIRMTRAKNEARLNELQAGWSEYGGDEIDRAHEALFKVYDPNTLDYAYVEADLNAAKDAFYEKLQGEFEEDGDDQKYDVLTPDKDNSQSGTENPEDTPPASSETLDDDATTPETPPTPETNEAMEEWKRQFGEDVLNILERYHQRLTEQDGRIDEQERRSRERDQELEALRAEHERANIGHENHRADLQDQVATLQQKVTELEQGQSDDEPNQEPEEPKKEGKLKKMFTWMKHVSDTYAGTKWNQYIGKIKHNWAAMDNRLNKILRIDWLADRYGDAEDWVKTKLRRNR